MPKVPSCVQWRFCTATAPPGVIYPTFQVAAATTLRLDLRHVEAEPLTLPGLMMRITILIPTSPKSPVFISMEAAGTIHKPSRGRENPTAAGPRLKELFLWEEVLEKTQKPQSC